MANKRDVSLIVRAKNQASKALDSVTGALREINKASKDFKNGSSGTDSVLASLGRELAKLDQAAGGGNAFDQLARGSEKAERTVSRLRDEVAQTAAQNAKLREEYRQSAAEASRLQQAVQKAEAALAAQKATTQQIRAEQGRNSDATKQAVAEQRKSETALKEVKAQARGAQQTVRSLTQEIQRNEGAFNRQGSALQQANVELLEVRQVSEQANASLSKLGTTVRTQLLRSLRDAQQRMEDFKRASQFGTATLAGMAGAGVSRGSPEFQSMVAQSRAAKKAYQEQQIAVERMRREVRAAGTDVQALTAAQKKFETATAAVDAKLQRNATSVAKAAQEVRSHRAATDRATEGNRRFSNSLALVRQNTRQSLSFVQRLRGEVLALATTYVGLQGALTGTRGVAKAYMTLEAVQNRLGAVFAQDTQRVAQEVDWLFAQADRLGISFDVLSDAYAKFAVAANAANFESAATRDVFLSVAEAGRVNKLSMEQMQGIFLALEQMISKGKITSEELRRQLGDRLPGAFNIMADALGMTTAELDNAMKAGNVFASQDNLLRFADQLRKRFGPQLSASLESFTAELGRMQNEIFRAELRAGQAGFIEGMRVAMVELTEFFKSADGQQFFNNLGAAAGNLMKALALVVKNFDNLLVIVAALIGRKLGAYVTALVADFRGLQGATAAATAQQQGLNAAQAQGVARAGLLTRTLLAARAGALSFAASLKAATVSLLTMVRGMFTLRGAATAVAGVLRVLRGILATLGGPIGLLTTGLSILFVNWATKADDATRSTSELKRQVDALKTAYLQATDKAKDWRKALEGVTRTQAAAGLEQYRSELRRGLDELESMVQERLRSSRRSQLPGSLGVSTGPSREDLVKLLGPIQALDSALSQGVVPDMNQFLKQVDEIVQKNPELESLGRNLLDAVTVGDGVKSLQRVTEEYKQQLRVLSILDGTLDEANAGVKDLVGDQDGGTVTPPGAPPPTGDSDADKLRKKQQEFLAGLKEENQARQFKLAMMKLEEQGLERQAAIQEEMRRAEVQAAKLGIDLSDEKYGELRKRIEETTAALWDQQNAARIASEKRQALEADVNETLQHRKEIMEAIEFAEQQGDGGAADRLRASLEGVNLDLEIAISRAQAYWQAMGGPDADAAILRLDNVRKRLGEVGTKATLSGKQINEMFASGAANGVMQFVDALAAGENAISSLGNLFRSFAADFLRQLARMIIQQAIFNAISGAAGGGGIGGAVANFFNVGTNHTGGLAGTGPSRAAAPGWFANAARYHQGGIAGLKPGEVPAILERGEEVLTRDDPRHAANGGAGGGAMPEFKIVNAIDAGDFVSQGMNTAPGQRAVLNFIRANKGQVKSIINS